MSESTIRSIKKKYIQAFKQAKADVTTLPHGNSSRSLKLGDFDTSVQIYICKLQIAGGIVNCTIAIAAAKGIVESHDSFFRFEPELGQIPAGKNEFC